jgi:hypothetical protein
MTVEKAGTTAFICWHRLGRNSVDVVAPALKIRRASAEK